VRGAFNVAAEPVLDLKAVAGLLGARTVPLPARVARGAAAAAYRLHAIPVAPGWLDMGLSVPTMDVTRAREELWWEPRHTALEAVAELLAGMRENAGLETPPLAPGASGPLRVRELLTGIGRRS
jgi:nucleoside-diphosphate-sugar epimerase